MTFRRVGVIAKPESREAVAAAKELAEWLRRRDLMVAVDKATRRASGLQDIDSFENEGAYDLVIALGGDGTLLAAARGLAEKVPILGVNLGTLGFLTEIRRSELYPSLVRILAGEFEIEERSLIDVELHRGGGGKLSFHALNDAVITKSAQARIIELTIRVDGSTVACYRSDGLIVSTPTGSTAYNLSAGGPIIHPQLPVIVLTPICPHTLTLRPLVVPDSTGVTVTLGTRGDEVYLALDGQEGTSLGHGDRVSVARSERSVELIKVSGRSFYESLRGKLGWGGLSENTEPQ